MILLTLQMLKSKKRASTSSDSPALVCLCVFEKQTGQEGVSAPETHHLGSPEASPPGFSCSSPPETQRDERNAFSKTSQPTFIKTWVKEKGVLGNHNQHLALSLHYVVVFVLFWVLFWFF